MTPQPERQRQFDVILFDLGGVLVELVGVGKMLEWCRLGGNPITETELWASWIHSPTVRAFESGRSDPHSFATGLISEFSLPVDEEQYLAEFTSWPKGLYPGAADLLNLLSSSHRTGSLTNCNDLHWDRLMVEMGLASLLDFNISSHETGLLKPDREAYRYAIDRLGCDPDRILFFDDNPVNVEAASALGIAAYRTPGIEPVVETLKYLGIINPDYSLDKR